MTESRSHHYTIYDANEMSRGSYDDPLHVSAALRQASEGDNIMTNWTVCQYESIDAWAKHRISRTYSYDEWWEAHPNE